MKSNRPHSQPRNIDVASSCGDVEWEAAYARFETPEQEIEKFVRRLKAFNFDQRPKDDAIVELFCGRGGGLHALERLGFTRLSGVDLSESLLMQYRGPAKLRLADCRQLPMDDASFDAVIVQGGLHHLPQLPEDLDAVLAEVKRILRPDGVFYLVEPWLTPFLRFVHVVVANPLVRKVYPKGDALATMIDHERDTYEQWLGMPETLLNRLNDHFRPRSQRTVWGKLTFSGTPRVGESESDGG